MHVRLRGPSNLFILEPDSPSLADEIAEARTDMNIKVAAFTVSEKSIKISVIILKVHRSQISMRTDLFV